MENNQKNIIRMETQSHEETHAIGQRVAGFLKGGETLSLIGPLGAGKTVFTQGLAAGLGVLQAVVSPTFTLLRVLRGRLTLMHFDFYRLESDVDAEDLLRENSPGENEVAVVEWADKFPVLFESAAIEVRIDYKQENKRNIIITSESALW